MRGLYRGGKSGRKKPSQEVMGDGGLASVVSPKTSGGPGIDVQARVVQPLHSGLWRYSQVAPLKHCFAHTPEKDDCKNLGWERLHLERMEWGGDHLGHVPGKWR